MDFYDVLSSNFGTVTDTNSLLVDNYQHGMQEVDIPFIPAPKNERNWDAWLNSGELQGFSEVSNDSGSYSELSGAELDKATPQTRWIDKTSGIDAELAEQCEAIIDRVTANMRELAIYMGKKPNRIAPAHNISPDYWRAAVFARTVLGDTPDAAGNWPEKPVGRCFRLLKTIRRVCRAVLSRCNATQRDLDSECNPHATRWFTSDRDCDADNLDHLEDGLGLMVPSSIWGQFDYRTDSDPAPQLGGKNPADYQHYGYFAGLRAARAEALRAWVGNNKRRAWALAGYTDSSVTTELGKVYKMSKLEEKEWGKRFRTLQAAWEKGRPADWRESSILTFGQMSKLKSDAWQVIKAG